MELETQKDRPGVDRKELKTLLSGPRNRKGDSESSERVVETPPLFFLFCSLLPQAISQAVEAECEQVLNSEGCDSSQIRGAVVSRVGANPYLLIFLPLSSPTEPWVQMQSREMQDRVGRLKAWLSDQSTMKLRPGELESIRKSESPWRVGIKWYMNCWAHLQATRAWT